MSALPLKIDPNEPAKLSINPQKYARLLRKYLPTAIQTEEQNEAYIKIMYEIDTRAEYGKATPEEEALADLLTVLVEAFEEEHYALDASTPLSMLKHTMDRLGLKQKDLVDVFGSPSIVSEVLSGKRDLSKEHIRRLAKRFKVSPELFFR